jgi:GH24 family phage-related lysozyme (muramidase)
MDQWTFTAPFEGIVPWLYKDSKGNVTCGVGFLVADEDALRRLPWSPSFEYARLDFQAVHDAPAGHTPAFYKPLCKARLSDVSMRAVFDRNVTAVRTALGPLHLERCPLPAQIALVDMAYNLGAANLLSVKKWPHLLAAVRAGQWAIAAEECHREDIQPARNAATRALFVSAGQPLGA